MSYNGTTLPEYPGLALALLHLLADAWSDHFLQVIDSHDYMLAYLRIIMDGNQHPGGFHIQALVMLCKETCWQHFHTCTLLV